MRGRRGRDEVATGPLPVDRTPTLSRARPVPAAEPPGLAPAAAVALRGDDVLLAAVPAAVVLPLLLAVVAPSLDLVADRSEVPDDDVLEVPDDGLLEVWDGDLPEELPDVPDDDLSEALADDLSEALADVLAEALPEDFAEVSDVDADDVVVFVVVFDVVSVEGVVSGEAAVSVVVAPAAGVLAGVAGVVEDGVSDGVAEVVEVAVPELPGPRPEPVLSQLPAMPAAVVAGEVSLLRPLLPHLAAAPAVVRLVTARAKAAPKSTRRSPRPGCGQRATSGRSGPGLRTAARCGATHGERPLPSGSRYGPPVGV